MNWGSFVNAALISCPFSVQAFFVGCGHMLSHHFFRPLFLPLVLSFGSFIKHQNLRPHLRLSDSEPAILTYIFHRRFPCTLQSEKPCLTESSHQILTDQSGSYAPSSQMKQLRLRWELWHDRVRTTQLVIDKPRPRSAESKSRALSTS